MARIFLINPPSPEPVRTPLLSFAYLAAALRRGGHAVGILDASAPHGPREADAIAAAAAAFRPDLVGLHLKTLHVRPAYALARALGGRFRLVAGGPHATVRPAEPLDHGFDAAVTGEGEEALVALADAVDAGRPLPRLVRGALIGELDGLASPLDALDLFEPRWYGGARAPAGLLSSRGCPAACTFCSNDVTGRKFRYRAAAAVAEEARALRDRFGVGAFSFFDDSFAVGRRRVAELCDALEARGPLHFTCTAHPAHLDRDVLRAMQRAGCGGVDLGMESADPGMLVRIGKGVTVERVLEVLAWCRELGLHSVVNLMFGWPDETDAELDATIDFMERAAGLAGGFNARGVVVPYPGTGIYERHHARFGFTDWWIREAPLAYAPFPQAWAPGEIARAYADDPALERNFFRHPPARVERIRAALARKAALTLSALGQVPAVAVPAAGAR